MCIYDSDSETGTLRQESTFIPDQKFPSFNTRAREVVEVCAQSYVSFVETLVRSALTRTSSYFFLIEIHRVVFAGDAFL